MTNLPDDPIDSYESTLGSIRSRSRPLHTPVRAAERSSPDSSAAPRPAVA